MKKAASIFLVLLLILPLGGCSYKNITAHSGTEYIISAIGFNGDVNGITMFLEAVVINSEDAEDDKKTQVLILRFYKYNLNFIFKNYIRNV